jgi:hypothetical protein
LQKIPIFEQTHHLKMFTMGFAGISSGEFSRLIIEKYGFLFCTTAPPSTCPIRCGKRQVTSIASSRAQSPQNG